MFCRYALRRATAACLALALILIVYLTGETPLTHVARAQGIMPTQVEFLNRSGDRITGVGGAYIDGQSCASSFVSSSALWLRTAKAGCDLRSVYVDLQSASSRTRDADGDFLFDSACGATPFQLDTEGLNQVHDLIIEGDSPFKNSAISNGIYLSKVTINVRQVYCDAFYLRYEDRFRVRAGSSPYERIVESWGTEYARLYKLRSGRHLYLGRFYLPMSFRVTLR